jgi:hypothetical protein
MANNAGTYLMFARLNWLRTATAFPASHANLYVALFTTTPFANNTGGVEVTGGSYARVAIAATGWSSISGATGSTPGQIQTTGATTFPTATADWGTITAIGLYDASTSGNLVELFPLFPTRAVFNGDTLTFAAGNIVIQEANVSTYLQTARLNWFKNTAYPSAPSTVYIALFSTTPLPDGTGGTEISAGGYARVAVAQGSASWNAQAGGGTSGTAEFITNNAAITFPTATADWGTIVGVGVYDASTSGNLLYVGALTASRTVLNGDIFNFASTTFQLSED